MLSEGNILLRRLSVDDAPLLAALANNRKIWINLRDVLPSPYTINDANSFISISTKDEPQTIFAIEYDGSFCGVVGIVPLSDVYRKTAEIGYWIGEPFWNKGIASVAVKLVTDYAFIELGFVRLHAGIFEYNKASMKVLLKNGYEQDGLFKKSIFKDGNLYDEYRFAKTV
jgi:[ribosomal protein S5]-alanine N-acetyltransferase